MTVLIKRRYIIKHSKFMDVALLVHKVHGPFGSTRERLRYKVRGEWINQGFEKTWSLGITQTITIWNKDLSDWFVCKEPQAECIRHTEWRELG